MIELTNKNADELINSRSILFFTAPWCAKCRKLEPMVEAISKLYDQEIQTATVLINEQHQVGKQFDIRFFPSVILQEDGKALLRLKDDPTLKEVDVFYIHAAVMGHDD